MGKVTYYGYEEGYDPRVLRLGNLAFDFTNPKMHMQYIHPEISSDTPNQLYMVLILKQTCSGQELDQWATSDERPVCYMASQDRRNFSFGLGLQDFLDFNSSRSGNSYSLVVGKEGSKVELIEYNQYAIFRFETLITFQAASFLRTSRPNQ